MTSATFDEAQTDWENVQEIVPKFRDQLVGDVGVIPKGGGVPDPHGGQSPHATLEEVILDFKAQDLSSQISQAEVRFNIFFFTISADFRSSGPFLIQVCVGHSDSVYVTPAVVYCLNG